MTSSVARSGRHPTFRPALEEIVAELPGAVYAIDGAGRILYLSEQIQALIGHSATDLMQSDAGWSSLVHPEDAVRVDGELSAGAEGTTPIEYRLVHRDGSDVWVRDHAIELEVDSTRQGVLLDITTPSSPTPGIKLTSVHVPAEAGPGGDWYEAIALPDGTLGLAIGDVTGHGIDAAAQMGTLRAALLAYALKLYEPGVVLERLNLIMRRSGAGMASVLYAILDPDQGILRFASAGHPPILLLTPSGNVRFLRAGSSPLLGDEYGEARAEAVVALDPGSTLLLYTDGVLDGRAKSLEDALDRLAEKVGDAAGLDLERLSAHLLPQRGSRRRDDAALLACRVDGIAEPELELRFDADPSQLRVLRRALGRWFDRLELARDDRFRLLLAVDEAARNAIEHAYGLELGSLAVRATYEAGEVMITVTDTGRWRPARGGRRGRGIPLIRRLVDAMEILDLEPGTQVMMVKRLRHAGAAAAVDGPAGPGKDLEAAHPDADALGIVRHERPM